MRECLNCTRHYTELESDSNGERDIFCSAPCQAEFYSKLEEGNRILNSALVNNPHAFIHTGLNSLDSINIADSVRASLQENKTSPPKTITELVNDLMKKIKGEN